MPVKSKVEEISLRPYEYLLPVFEILVNAIISVKERHKNGGGIITIKIKREDSLDSTKSLGLFKSKDILGNDEKSSPFPIEAVTVIDNGLGFNDNNIKSFNTAYSETHKLQGCKGVGRFTVLACFEKMEVESIYNNEGKQYKRSFVFDVENEVLPKDGNPVILESKVSQETIVKVSYYKTPYKQKSAITTKAIAEAIIEHCLPFFISSNMPILLLKDDYENSDIVLNDLFQSVIQLDGKPKTFKLIENEDPFEILIVKRTDERNRTHRLKLCANSRVVGKAKNIASLLNGFESPLTDANDKFFFIDVYVLSKFLDKKVNTIRNKFNIPDAPEDDSLHQEITIDGIEKLVVDMLSSKYDKDIQIIHKNNYEKIKNYILNPKKMRFTYRSLLGNPELLKSIPTNASDELIEEHLHRIKFQIEKDVNKSLKKALKKGTPESYDEYSKVLRNLIDQEAKLSKDKLADLLIRRKSIIALFKKLYRLTKDGKYNYEEDLHNIIFPMGETNDSIPYEYHNLWLLDERLAFHSYVASDKKLRTNPIADNKSSKEPDVLIFDFPWAFSEKDGQMTSMILFEFKRPGRDMNNSEDKKLDSQLMQYFEDLMESKAKDYNGEYINMEKTTPKFGYIICDLHKDLMDYNTNFNGFRSTPNKTLYKLNDVINLHIEAMSYQQLVEMSEKRHMAFFKELGIDSL